MDLPDARSALDASNICVKKSRPRSFNVILDRVAQSIRKAIRLGLKSAVTDIPAIMYGEPHYDINEATRFVKETLEARGYWVVRNDNVATIAIGWEHASTGEGSAENECTELDKYDIGL